MKHVAIFAGAALCAAAAAAAATAPLAARPEKWTAKPGRETWQERRHAEKLAEAAAGPAKTVFIGDSITHFWEKRGREVLAKHFGSGDRKMLNLGFSADRTEHVLWRIRKGGELDNCKAKFVHIMIGTNNTGHRPQDKEPPADTILGIREVLTAVREKQPDAVIVLSSIFPRGAKPNDPKRIRNDIVNEEIRKFCDASQNVFWCDFSDAFLEADGTLPKTLFPDGLHPSAAGYEIWAEALKPYVNYAFSDRKGPAPRPRNCIHRTATSRPADVPAAAWPATRIRRDTAAKPDWWTRRLLERRSQIAESGGEFDVVFLGDSITHNWEHKRYGGDALAKLSKTYKILDAGYGGDRTQHLLWRIRNGELDGYKAKCIMLMIGTNNSARDKAEDVVAGIRAILDTIAAKQPQAKVLLLPIFPRGASAADPKRQANEKVNAAIKAFADGKQIVWVDFGAKFLDKDGDVKWIMRDRLHPGPEGYKIWADAVLPYFKEACGR